MDFPDLPTIRGVYLSDGQRWPTPTTTANERNTMTIIILSSIALISLPVMFSLDGLFAVIEATAAKTVAVLRAKGFYFRKMK